MKNQFLATLAILICVSLCVVSCDKKEAMNMTGMTITMSYSPNPVLKDSTITFNFEVMQDTMLQAVTNTSCEVIKGASNSTMAITEVSVGKYTGTCKFTQIGTYALHFKYMHQGMDADQDFSLIVQ